MLKTEFDWFVEKISDAAQSFMIILFHKETSAAIHVYLSSTEPRKVLCIVLATSGEKNCKTNPSSGVEPFLTDESFCHYLMAKLLNQLCQLRI